MQPATVRRTATVFAVAAVSAVVAVSLAGVTGVSAATQGDPVRVINPTSSPVPVAGTVNVGALPATTTANLFAGTLGGSGGTFSTTVGVASYKTVRLFIGRIFGTGCDFSTSTIDVQVTDVTTGSHLDVFQIGQDNYTNKVYETPGTSLRVTISGPTACTEDVALWGRSN